MLRLTDAQSKELLSEPESGMGYQTVEVTKVSGVRSAGVAYNAELLVFDDELGQARSASGFAQLLAKASSAAGEVRAIRVTSIARKASLVRGTTEDSATSKRPAKDAPIGTTNPTEEFKRFSAYANDRRVQPDRRLLPGSYATTAEDAKNVKTGSQAVVRYALPDATPASYVFTVLPRDNTKVQRGTTEPAFGQIGGGVEVIFPDGTQRFTVTRPERIPD